jgi:hypothetical protein
MFDRVLIIDDYPVRLPTVTQLLAKSDIWRSPSGVAEKLVRTTSAGQGAL